MPASTDINNNSVKANVYETRKRFFVYEKNNKK